MSGKRARRSIQNTVKLVALDSFAAKSEPFAKRAARTRALLREIAMDYGLTMKETRRKALAGERFQEPFGPVFCGSWSIKSLWIAPCGMPLIPFDGARSEVVR